MICFSVSIAFADQEKLYDAATLGDEAQVKQLLAAGDSPNKPNSMGSYPLHGAVLSGHLKIVELLIKNGADVNLKDPLTQQNTLSNGGYGNLAITKVLVQSGVDINQQGSNQGRILPSPCYGRSCTTTTKLLCSF